MNFNKRYILFLKDTQQVIITSDGPAIAERLGVSRYTVTSWFRKGITCVDRYDKEGFILVRGATFVKSKRGTNNFKKTKYNW